MEDYTPKEKEILSYLSKLDLSRKVTSNYNITLFINIHYSKTKKDDTWFEMSRYELVSFLEKRGNTDFSLVDSGLKNAGINSDERFFVNFY